MSAPPLLEAKGIRKVFPGTVALDGVDFDLGAGEVHALVGENGAGKTTLMMVMAGVHRPDSGALFVAGRPVRLAHPGDAQLLGISTVFQELSLVPRLTVAENVFANRLPAGALGLVNRRALYERTRRLLEEFELDINPGESIMDLDLSRRQVVEIAKALSLDVRILLLDEPTSALNEAEVGRLFAILRRLKGRGIGIIFTSHKLNEIFDLADRITVVRDGRRVLTRAAADTDPDEVIRSMVGSRLGPLYPERQSSRAEAVLEARGLTTRTGLRDVSFQLRAGEILGVAGLRGAGQAELVRVLSGLRRLAAGELRVGGTRITLRGPFDAVRAGIAPIAEDRREAGLFPDLSVAQNLSSTSLDTISTWGIVDHRRERRLAAALVERFKIRARPDAPIRTLSGGNQQKVAVSKWLVRTPRAILAHEPTRGVDVGAKADIHRMLIDLAAGGTGVLLVSSELPEVLGLSHRILVMQAGRITAEVNAGEISEEQLAALSSGSPPRRAAGGR